MREISIRPIIGLEIHVQLATRTKLFCGCAVEFAAEPNSRVCPICMGLPGALPVMNRQAYEYAVLAGLALNCKIAAFSKWDRKSYYYPDLPKNYQISQYDLPLASGGHFDIARADGTIKSVGIIRAHLEEDAGKNLHEGRDHTRVDLNRAGTPLLEIVTEPDLADADEAYTLCVELQRLVRHLGISEADMQKGQMRFEPNVNIAITEGSHRLETSATGLETSATGLETDATSLPQDATKLWHRRPAGGLTGETPVPQVLLPQVLLPQSSSQDAKILNSSNTERNTDGTGGREYRTPISEIKNLNSFRSVRGAINYEIDRQLRAWEADHDYTLEKKGKMNFGWNDDREITEFQRGKEESHDYRYFPDPDLMPVTPDSALLERLREQVGELPVARQRRFIDAYGMTAKDCEMILADRQTATLYEEVIGQGADAKILTKHFAGIWNRLASAVGTTVGQLGMPAAMIAELVQLAADGVVSATAATQIADRLYKNREDGPRSPMEVAQELGVIQERQESALLRWVQEAFDQNPQAVQDALGIHEKKVKAAIGFLRGRVMRLSQGKADPKLAGEMIEQKLTDIKSTSGAP